MIQTAFYPQSPKFEGQNSRGLAMARCPQLKSNVEMMEQKKEKLTLPVLLTPFQMAKYMQTNTMAK